MNLAMERALLRRACARVTDALADCRQLPEGELFMARMAMLPVLGLASRGPMLALPWRDSPPVLDQKTRAAGDDTLC